MRSRSFVLSIRQIALLLPFKNLFRSLDDVAELQRRSYNWIILVYGASARRINDTPLHKLEGKTHENDLEAGLNGGSSIGGPYLLAYSPLWVMDRRERDRKVSAYMMVEVKDLKIFRSS
jgi:hypothetical protein